MLSNLTIFKFEARFFPAGDGEVTAGRFEYIAYRTDGKKFRIRPGTSGATEELPVLWAGEDTLLRACKATPCSRSASSQQHRPQCVTHATGNEFLQSRVQACPSSRSASSQQHRPQCVTDATGKAFLQSRVQAWESSISDSDHAPRFTTDLTIGHIFSWSDFLNRNVHSRRLKDRTVVECWLVWVGWTWHCAGFYLRFENNTQTVYTVMPSGSWQAMDRMVRDIYWAA